jgi:ferredoxin-NADP reductase
MSMLRTLCSEQHGEPVTFVHYCLSGASMTYGPELDGLAARHPNVRIVRIFTGEPGGGDLDGFVDRAQLDAIDPSWPAAETFLCGPAPLMDSLRQIYDECGIGARLHTEAFSLAHFAAEAGSLGANVRFGLSGASWPSDGRPLLEQAESAGLRPAFGCRRGICRTCICPLVSGHVRNVATGELTSGRGQDIRICVSAPVGDVEIDL